MLTVKWIEAAGARVVPLQFDLSEEQLLDRYNQINGTQRCYLQIYAQRTILLLLLLGRVCQCSESTGRVCREATQTTVRHWRSHSVSKTDTVAVT